MRTNEKNYLLFEGNSFSFQSRIAEEAFLHILVLLKKH